MRAHHVAAIAAIAAIALLGGCGPTEREVGLIVLLSLPAIVIGGAVLQIGYRALWRWLIDPDLGRFQRRPTVWLLGISSAMFSIPIFREGFGVETVMIGVAFAGSTYAAYLLVAMRLTVTRPARYAWAALIPWLLLAPLGAVLAVGGSPTADGSGYGLYFMLPGYAGIVPGVIAVLLLIEIAIRRSIIRQREREQEPVFPTARVHLEDEPTPQSPRQFVARSARR